MSVLGFIGLRGSCGFMRLIFLTVFAVLRPSSKAWRTAFKDLPPVPEELAEYI